MERSQTEGAECVDAKRAMIIWHIFKVTLSSLGLESWEAEG